MKTIGEQYNEILEELHDGLWEHEGEVGTPFDFPPEALRNATKIFATVMMDRIWKRSQASNMNIEITGKMAQDCGNEIRDLVKKFTLVDLHDFY